MPSDGAHVSARDRGLHAGRRRLRDDAGAERHGVPARAASRAARASASRSLAIPAPAELRDWVVAAMRARRSADGERPPDRHARRRPAVASRRRPMPGPTVIVTRRADAGVRRRSIYEAGLTRARRVRTPQRALDDRRAQDARRTPTAVAALLEARRAGADEALFLDTEGHCSEATASNLFAVIDGRAADAAALVRRASGYHARGGARARRARSASLSPSVPFELDELLVADEAFLTSSLRGIAPLVRVGRHADRRTGSPAPCTRQADDRLRRARRAGSAARDRRVHRHDHGSPTAAVNCAPMGVEWVGDEPTPSSSSRFSRPPPTATSRRPARRSSTSPTTSACLRGRRSAIPCYATVPAHVVRGVVLADCCSWRELEVHVDRQHAAAIAHRDARRASRHAAASSSASTAHATPCSRPPSTPRACTCCRATSSTASSSGCRSSSTRPPARASSRRWRC